jgi:hypothetical protein
MSTMKGGTGVVTCSRPRVSLTIRTAHRRSGCLQPGGQGLLDFSRDVAPQVRTDYAV